MKPIPLPQTRVLVIDEDETNARVVAESLAQVGYECVVATSGNEGMRLIGEQTFDIISELIGEGTDGLEVLAMARRQQPDAEVIIMTGRGTRQSAVAAFREGAMTYVTKPLDIGKLCMVVRKASRPRKTKEAPPSRRDL